MVLSSVVMSLKASEFCSSVPDSLGSRNPRRPRGADSIVRRPARANPHSAPHSRAIQRWDQVFELPNESPQNLGKRLQQRRVVVPPLPTKEDPRWVRISFESFSSVTNSLMAPTVYLPRRHDIPVA